MIFRISIFSVNVLFFAFASHAVAQKEDPSGETSPVDEIEHATVVDTRAIDPMLLFSMRLPFRIAPIANRHELSFDYHIGNTWNPSGVIEYPDASEPYPAHPWEVDYHPPYSENPKRYQFYSTDGIIRHATISFARKTSKSAELYGTLNINMLIDRPRFLDHVVSDATIESLHRIIFDQDDPFRRYKHGLNRAEMKFMDREGHTFEIKPRQLFMGTVDFGYRHFATLVRNRRVLWTLTGSAQLGFPLDKARRHLSLGLLTGSAATFQTGKKSSLTVAAAYTGQYDQLVAIRKKRYDPGYRNFMTGYRFMLAQNFDFKNNDRFSVGIELQGVPSPLSRRKRVIDPYLNPEDIGVPSSYTPEYWTPDDPIAITNQRRAGRTMIRGSEYISLNFSYRFGKSVSAPTLSIYFQEDWTLVYDAEGTLPLFTSSNNAQDFGAGIRFVKPFK